MVQSEYREEYHRFGLKSWQGIQPTWNAYHRHDEIELDYIESGELTFRFSHGHVILRTGDLGVFWGAIPHQVIAVAKGTVLQWLTVPLADALEWRLPPAMTRRLLHGTISVDRDPGDHDRFIRWHQDLQSRDADRRLLVLLEAQARLRRLALSTARLQSSPANHDHADGKVERMASFMAQHATEPLRVEQIARVVNLHPDYAVTLFKKTCGMGLIEYVNLQRTAHAQRLLATTDREILDIAFTCGFGSASRFYAVFAQVSGQTPRAFRAEIRHGRSG